MKTLAIHFLVAALVLAAAAIAQAETNYYCYYNPNMPNIIMVNNHGTNNFVMLVSEDGNVGENFKDFRITKNDYNNNNKLSCFFNVKKISQFTDPKKKTWTVVPTQDSYDKCRSNYSKVEGVNTFYTYAANGTVHSKTSRTGGFELLWRLHGSTVFFCGSSHTD